jgi:flavin-dependent dehydrogenase
MHIQRWANGRVSDKLLEVCLNDTDKIEYLTYDGRTILEEPFLLKPEHKYSMLAGHRGEMHQIICDYATEIGVDMRFGSKVVKYLDAAKEVGVILESGEKILGDVVVASDGPKSLGREQLLGLSESKVNSGYAIYRAYYDLTEEHHANPLFKKLTRKSPNVAEMWIGRDIHGFVYTWKEGTTIGWVLTHKVISHQYISISLSWFAFQ